MPNPVRIIKRIIRNPRNLLLYLARVTGWMKFLPDPIYLKYIWWAQTGTKLDLENPRGFNEKLHWLKIHDRDARYTIMADKYKVREYVSETIGDEYLIPLLGVWDHASEIDFDSLPNEFVLKCNHNSRGGLCVCTDKSTLDRKKVTDSLDRNMKRNYYWPEREWVYKNIERKIIAERYMKDDDTNGIAHSLIDYKFYCFHGEPKFLYVGVDDISSGKKGGLRLTLLDPDWNTVPFYRKDHEEIPFPIEKPECLDRMLQLSRKLSGDIPFVRVDLYYINHKIYFSEMTFYPGGGAGFFSPEEWEMRIGDWIRLPNAHAD